MITRNRAVLGLGTPEQQVKEARIACAKGRRVILCSEVSWSFLSSFDKLYPLSVQLEATLHSPGRLQAEYINGGQWIVA